MSELLRKLRLIDLIAMVTITGGLILKFFGIDGVVGTILTAIVLFYFGEEKITEKIKAKKFPEAKSESVEQIIRRVAKEEKIDPDLALRVARCESGLNPAATHKNSTGTVDRGLFQINNHWHPEVSDETVFDVERSTRFFCKAFKEGHLSWWSATKKCWNI